MAKFHLATEEWEKLPKYRCAKLVASYPRRIDAVIAAKGCFNKVLSKGSEFLCKHNISVLYLYTFAQISKNLFLLCHYRVVCVDV